MTADMSDRTRKSHAKLNGVIFNIKQGALTDKGKYIKTAEEVNCRCTSSPIVPQGLFS